MARRGLAVSPAKSKKVSGTRGRVPLLPSRGVRWGSGLAPPPHLVGERARALDVLERGGLVCASALALAERKRALELAPEPTT